MIIRETIAYVKIKIFESHTTFFVSPDLFTFLSKQLLPCHFFALLPFTIFVCYANYFVTTFKSFETWNWIVHEYFHYWLQINIHFLTFLTFWFLTFSGVIADVLSQVMGELHMHILEDHGDLSQEWSLHSLTWINV